MTLVEELREQGITLEAVGHRLKFRGPEELITPALRQHLAAHKAEILALLHNEVAGTLEPRIRFARSEIELANLVDQIEAGVKAGELSQAQTERLTYMVIATARQLRRGLVNILASSCLEEQSGKEVVGLLVDIPKR